MGGDLKKVIKGSRAGHPDDAPIGTLFLLRDFNNYWKSLSIMSELDHIFIVCLIVRQGNETYRKEGG